MNKYSYRTQNGTVKGHFDIYQGRDGSIYLLLGNSVTRLSLDQVNELKINTYNLKNYDHDLFNNAYQLQVS